MRSQVVYSIKDPAAFKRRLFLWGQQYREVAWLDSNGHRDSYSGFDALLAVGAASALIQEYPGAFEALKTYRHQTNDWLFGYLSYDLKNDLEALESRNFDGLRLPELCFFQPLKIIRVRGHLAEFLYLDADRARMEADFKSISDTPQNSEVSGTRHRGTLKVQLRIFKDAYFRKVAEMQRHIARGDIYEANFCQEFFAEDAVIDPPETYMRLNERSRAPFAAFLKWKEAYLLSASPERFLRKAGQQITSQPMKGTAGRSADPEEDLFLKSELQRDPKERAENIMIVDLVRNDLSRVALRGSVAVSDVCEVRTYRQVHQMISTVSARVEPGFDPVSVLQQAFPMGSMTGVPKLSAMRLIERLEASKRGVYSGALGYFDPMGDFDFSVLIRSILYNSRARYVSYSVGSAITSASDPQKEYQECLLKARAMREVLENA